MVLMRRAMSVMRPMASSPSAPEVSIAIGIKWCVRDMVTYFAYILVENIEMEVCIIWTETLAFHSSSYDCCL